MKVFLYKQDEKIVFANEGKGGFIGNAPSIDEAKEKASEMYKVFCLFSTFQNFKNKSESDKNYKPSIEDCIMPEEIEFIISK